MFIESFFYSHPIFRFEEFVQWKIKQGTNNPQAMWKALHYHTKAGHLINIRRGLYAFIPPNETLDTILIDPYLLAAKLAVDSTLAYHSALELHGVAYSVFEKFSFLTVHKNKSFEFQGRLYQPVSHPTVLKNQDLRHFGVEKTDRQGQIIYVTNLERTFVDVLDRIELSGGWEEVLRSISNMVILNLNEVIRYCLMHKNRILTAKVGFFLEQRQGAFAVDNEALDSLLKFKPSTPQYLMNHSLEQCRLVKKWNLMVPLRVLEKSWEEPEHDI